MSQLTEGREVILPSVLELLFRHLRLWLSRRFLYRVQRQHASAQIANPVAGKSTQGIINGKRETLFFPDRTVSGDYSP